MCTLMLMQFFEIPWACGLLASDVIFTKKKKLNLETGAEKHKVLFKNFGLFKKIKDIRNKKVQSIRTRLLIKNFYVSIYKQELIFKEQAERIEKNYTFARIFLGY